MGEIWGAPSPWLSPSPSVVTFTFTLRLRLRLRLQPPPFQPHPHPQPTPAFIATRGLVLIPAPPLSRCDADREVLRQLWGGGVRVLPVLTKTDLLDQVILRGALVRGRSHLLVAVVVKLPCSTGQQKDAATLASVRPLSLRAHPSRLPTCPVHIPPAPCTSYLPRAHPTCPVHMAARRRADGHPPLMPCLFMPCQAQLMNSHTVVHAQLTAEAAQAAPP